MVYPNEMFNSLLNRRIVNHQFKRIFLAFFASLFFFSKYVPIVVRSYPLLNRLYTYKKPSQSLYTDFNLSRASLEHFVAKNKLNALCEIHNS